MEIYEETHESISHKLSSVKSAPTAIPEGTDDDDALDMFMDTAKKQEAEGEGDKDSGNKQDDVVAPSMDDEV